MGIGKGKDKRRMPIGGHDTQGFHTYMRVNDDTPLPLMKKVEGKGDSNFP